MNFLLGAVLVIHVVVCLFLIGVVLLQQGKSADLAGTFGGQGSQTAFGPRAAANLLTKMTGWAAALFMVTSLSLTILYLRSLRVEFFRSVWNQGDGSRFRAGQAR